jgi:SAM-dependent methyltransferase
VEDQPTYWDRFAAEKQFTHPLHQPWLDRAIPANARILDYGCGYGRVLDRLWSLNYRNTVGIDYSPQMVARGRRENPHLACRCVDGLPLDEPDASFDAVILFAVLTCIPQDRAQDEVLREARRLLRPGGVLYLSDMPLQSDSRAVERYQRDVPRFGMHGVFQTQDGAVMRHHSADRLEAFMAGFDRIDTRDVRIESMNGNPANAIQILGRRR